MTRITVTKVFTFDSAHQLADYDGKCANVHGHTYILEVTVGSTAKQNEYTLEQGGPKDSMLIDFSILKEMVKDWILDVVDHQPLHQIFSWRTTAENLALWIKGELTSALQSYPNIELVKLRLYETSSSYVEVINE